VSNLNRPYIIMDYLSGGSLGDALTNRTVMPWPQAIDVGIKLAGALATAHAAGVLHRDVKPENVLLSAYGEPQLADFGVARLQGGTRTASGTITGSLAQAAPEVLSGVSATEASDVWSLSSTIATLMAGVSPFHRDGDQSLHPLVTRILTAEPTDLRPMGVPPEICEVLEAGMTKDSWKRPSTAIVFGEALQNAQRSLGMQPTPMAAPHAAEAHQAEAEALEPASADPRTEAATIRRTPNPTPVPASVSADSNGNADDTNPPRGFNRWRPSS
jgi:serine/threonine protein kinase